MAIVQILKQRQITLPTSIPDQSWFWTQKWQMKEREADKDIAEGRLIGPFSDAQTAIKMLKSKNRKI
ncbi:MAG: hypothetical protein UW39_C0007G0066 [Parcubacteria group bacterium GW2011_GWC2_44_17]|uniref:Uncharacterized protein n=1 Tax=Candidatus Jacksonbacteria bacterium RIFCSPLOWO2_02_FULL_44_20 TaxID=1798460 RepID=A0A1G2A894_9BACT|nr:MAG: hypothetical protein UW39_C0007G0066 [Parcubacteria group bacterium GW2011_GWC2_44_17]KKT49475.1 MAG: hypothetical protein UW40_C0020G0002 [Parcubacteria group bacterium GW2011_GWF2_44_17]OGY70689.1 MAG: hypothetical protein A3C00_03145 [Candidatus Jacksonbacteria bacterium RIFCSPHIGHO2_02_FULL_44_25]OGY72051.1 MAG: hypothetical protein A3E05_01770 [Candidatus Jacksonbacteria bacterium RIFCSPHIGHO2_12_FULL_44_12]OGY72706.1 MAG: hypothetical protein A3H61_04670 [Candidatus Jacksonbacteri